MVGAEPDECSAEVNCVEAVCEQLSKPRWLGGLGYFARRGRLCTRCAQPTNDLGMEKGRVFGIGQGHVRAPIKPEAQELQCRAEAWQVLEK